MEIQVGEEILELIRSRTYICFVLFFMNFSLTGQINNFHINDKFQYNGSIKSINKNHVIYDLNEKLRIKNKMKFYEISHSENEFLLLLINDRDLKKLDSKNVRLRVNLYFYQRDKEFIYCLSYDNAKSITLEKRDNKIFAYFDVTFEEFSYVYLYNREFKAEYAMIFSGPEYAPLDYTGGLHKPYILYRFHNKGCKQLTENEDVFKIDEKISLNYLYEIFINVDYSNCENKYNFFQRNKDLIYSSLPLWRDPKSPIDRPNSINGSSTR